METVAVWLTYGAGFYVAAGMLFGLWFIASGVRRIDPAAIGTGLGFRMLILPGATALWPLLLIRVMKDQGHPPVECNAHRRSSGGFRP